MTRYYATFPYERRSGWYAITPLRHSISDVAVDVARPRHETGKPPPDGVVVFIFRNTRKRPILHGVYKWVNNGVERRLRRVGDSGLVARLQAILLEEGESIG